jgi:hypothetical protein
MNSTSEYVRFQAERERSIARPILRELVELHEQRRHEVERDLDRRKLAEQGDHAEVILQRMHPDPRQDVFARYEVLVERLVHVPQNRHTRHTV